MLESFLKTYADRAYRHATMVRHNGTVLAFAMDDRRRIVYSVLDAANTAAASDADRWLAVPAELPFASEVAEVGVAAVDPTPLPIVRKGTTAPVAPGTPVSDADVDPFLSSTARLSADAPFQVVSDGVYVHLFRQSVAGDPLVDSNLLVDRFVLVGTELQAKREVRFQRSRNRTRPQSSKDGLGALDLDGRPFIEPTQVLKLVAGLDQGRFAVVLVPTQVPDVARWQIFVVNAHTPLIDAYSIARDADGLFDTAGAQDPGAATGFAGSALRFSADGDHLDLGPGTAVGAPFTFESWLNVAADAPDHMELVGDAPALSIEQGTRVRLTIAGAASTTGDILTPGTWNHVAVSFDGTYVRVYVDGVLRHRGTELSGKTVTGNVTRFGAGYRGVIDELRLWRVARSAADVQGALSHRLTGLEPGLAGYWRLDDVNGDTAWDLHPTAPNAASVEGPAWITSDAPIGDAPGLTRTGFRVYPTIVTSGLSALLYYQQETAPSGYDRAAKAYKSAARVMLAFATEGNSATRKGQVVALDFGVSPSGRLAQSPTELALPTLERPTPAGGTAQEQSARIAQLAAQLEALREHATALVTAQRIEDAIRPVLDEGADPNLQDFTGIPQDLEINLILYAGTRDWFGAYFEQPVLDARAAARAVLATAPDAAGTQAQIAATSAALAAAELALTGGTEARMPIVHADPTGLSVSGALLDYALTADTPLLYDSALGRVSLYLRGSDDAFLVSTYDTLTDRARTVLSAQTGALALVSRSANLGGPDTPVTAHVAAGETDDTCTLTIALDSDAAKATETWTRLPRDVAALAAVLNGTAGDPVHLGAADAADGRIDALSIPDGIAAGAAAGVTLRAGADSLVLSAAVAAGDTTLPVDPTTVTINAGTPIYAIAYDYAADASTDRVPATLAGGSGIVAAIAGGASGPVALGEGTAVGAAAATRWFAEEPGGALTLDGTSAAAQLPGDASALASQGDLTLEAWVQPRPAAGVSRVVTHGGYGLALRGRPTAFHFDGAHDGVLLPAANALAITGAITLEAWVRPEKTDGLRDIVARGSVASPPSEVYLRIANGMFQIGSWNGTDHLAATPVVDADLKAWVHIAGVYDGTTWRLYRNGVEVANHKDATGAVDVQATWTVGVAASSSDRFFSGGIDEVRIWRGARTPAQIAAGRSARVTGTEPGLAGFWRPDVPVNGTATSPRYLGAPQRVVGPFGLYTAIAHHGAQAIETTVPFAADRWTHLAAAHHQAYAVHAAGDGAYLDCGTSETLDLVGDLTVEAGIALDDLSAPQGIAARGGLSAADDGLPWALSVDTAGRLVFGFSDTAGGINTFRSAAGAVSAGSFQRVAVTRKHTTVVDAPDAGTDPAKLNPGTLVHSYDDIVFYVNGQNVGGARWTGAGAATGSGPARLGRAPAPDLGGAPASLRGRLAEARVWNVARPASAIGATITGSETGLVSWWRFAENAGTHAADSKSANHGGFHGSLTWVQTPDPAGSSLVLYVDGVAAATGPPAAPLAPAAPQFSIGANAGGERFTGQLAELRVWNVLRTPQEIRDDLYRRLTGETADLLAYYPCALEAPGTLTDHGTRGNSLKTSGAAALIASTAPLGEELPLVHNALSTAFTGYEGTIAGSPSIAEYAVLETDAQGQLSGAFKRCYGVIQDGRWLLYTGFKVGDLDAEWVGQAQFDPQLIGYIEGAPPVPSENLTVADDYTDASAVTLTDAESATYTYANSRDSGFDSNIEAALAFGSAEKVNIGLGVETEAVAEKLQVGLKTSFELSMGWLDDSSRGQGTTVTRVSSLGLRGAREETPAYPDLGARFVPENTGFALVQSQTADVFALRLVHTGALVSYQMRPNPDIPKDWNVITFPIDPHYTKQGTLDGRVGRGVDGDYPDAGSYSPDSSYFKPIEAYALKNQIALEQQRLQARFAAYDAGTAGRSPSGATPPSFEKRNLVNTYVWTAAGGQFAEEQQTLDTISESTGGSYSFKGLAGITGGLELAIGGVAIEGELSALFGGHLELSATKTADSQTSFGVQSVATPEPAIGATGKRESGKVDAYRYMTFYLEPSSDAHDTFFGRVVDPIWLQQSNDPAAAALRQAEQPGKRPPAWRVLHRVTYVSRVLAPVPVTPGAEPSLEQTLISLDMDSNYELIRVLDPFVRPAKGRYGDFVAAVKDAVARFLPELQPHLAEVISFLVLYYSVPDGPGIAAAPEDLSRLAPPPPSVHAGDAQVVSLHKGAALAGTALDEIVPAASLVLTWTPVSGPGAVTFANAHAATTTARFSDPGVYVLRLTADNGRLTAHDDLEITVTGAPLPAAVGS